MDYEEPKFYFKVGRLVIDISQRYVWKLAIGLEYSPDFPESYLYAVICPVYLRLWLKGDPR